MSDENIQGTFRIDGVLQGRDIGEDFAGELSRWTRRMRREHGLRFSLQADAGGFDLLAVPKQLWVEEVTGGDERPEEVLRAALAELLARAPERARPTLSSTLRSVEIVEGAEIHTTYDVAPDGSVEASRARRPAPTVAPRRGPAGQRKVFWVTVIVVVIVALGAWSYVTRQAGPDSSELTDPNALAIEVGPLGTYLSVVDKAPGPAPASLRLTVRRTDAYPADANALSALWRASAGSPRRRLALEALIRGYVRCEFYDAEGTWQGFSIVRIAPLSEAETIELLLRLPPDPPATRLRITY
jgi:hypothetical protein